MNDLGTYAENTWCPGCGNFGILNAFKRAVKTLEKEGIGREKIAISTGIGCHGKYLITSISTDYTPFMDVQWRRFRE